MSEACKETIDNLEEQIEELKEELRDLKAELEGKDEEIEDLETQVYELENSEANAIYDGSDPVQVMKWDLILQNFGELTYLETVEKLKSLKLI